MPRGASQSEGCTRSGDDFTGIPGGAGHSHHDSCGAGFRCAATGIDSRAKIATGRSRARVGPEDRGRRRKRDTEELFTSGGPQNGASLEVQAIRSGDYSFRAGLIPEADTAIAQRYLLAAVALAPKELQSGIQGFARRLARQPRDSQAVRAELGRILGRTIAGDFRTLLNAAFEAL